MFSGMEAKEIGNPANDGRFPRSRLMVEPAIDRARIHLQAFRQPGRHALLHLQMLIEELGKGGIVVHLQIIYALLQTLYAPIAKAVCFNRDYSNKRPLRRMHEA